MNKNLKGTIMVLMAGIAWGISGISGQYLMAHGMNINLLTSVRLIVSGLLLTAMAMISQPQHFFRAIKQPKVLGGIAVFAIIGLLMNQYAYLMAIHYTNAGTATVLQYVAPIIILAYVSLKNKQVPTLSEFFAILFAILGTFIIATHGHFDGLAMTPKGFFWGLFSAVTYSFYIVLPAKLIREFGSFTVIGLGMLMGGRCFSNRDTLMAVSSSVNIRELVSFIWDYHYRNCLCLHFLLKRDYDYWGCERELACSDRTSLISFFLGNHYA